MILFLGKKSFETISGSAIPIHTRSAFKDEDKPFVTELATELSNVEQVFIRKMKFKNSSSIFTFDKFSNETN